MTYAVNRSTLTSAGQSAASRVLIVSNRLPVTVVRDDDGIDVRRSNGGLATGLSGVRQRHQSCWIGWTGLVGHPEPAEQEEIELRLEADNMVPLHLSPDEIGGFYRGYSNAALWPTLHDMPAAAWCNDDWRAYCAVNARFADAVVRELRQGDVVWVHDYHLMLVPRLVRRRCPRARIGFFLHTPFPSAESFARLPHAVTLLDGLLAADAIGVHTEEYAHNLVTAVGAIRGPRLSSSRLQSREAQPRVFACPISVDVASLGAIAMRPHVIREAERLRGTRRIVLGVDRLDYTKGIPERLRAFERLLEHDPELRGTVRFIQIAVPSREDVPGYKCTRTEVEEIVNRVNSRWGTDDWQPIEYHYRCVDLPTLVSLYRAASVMLVTPLRDGLNLVAKEFAAARVDNDGVLVLSERAGAAAELRTALLVNPSDEDALEEALAVALEMPLAERRVRMRHLRSTIANHDVHRWARCALDHLVNEASSSPPDSDRSQHRY